MKTLSAIGGIILIIAAFWGVYQYNENRYALAQALKQTNEAVQQTNQKIDRVGYSAEYGFKSIQSTGLNDRIWQIEQRWGKEPKDPIINAELKKLYQDKKAVDDRLQELQKIK